MQELKESDLTKVTMNLSSKTLQDIELIAKITGNKNRTNVVGTALRVYRILLELQEKDKGQLMTQDAQGTLTKIQLIY